MPKNKLFHYKNSINLLQVKSFSPLCGPSIRSFVIIFANSFEDGYSRVDDGTGEMQTENTANFSQFFINSGYRQ